MKKNLLSKIFALVMSVLSLITLCAFITTNIKVSAEEETYEVADEISINDLNGNKSGSKIILAAHEKYTFKQVAEHYSTKFTFIYKCLDPSTVDCQIHFSTSWLGDDHGGVIWLRNDHHYLSRVGHKAGYESTDPFPAAGNYQVECGKLYCLTGENKGKYKVYLSIDGVEKLHIYIEDMPKISGIFMTGKTGDIMIDTDWTGSAYTFKANGEVFSSGSTIEDYLTKPATDPTKEGYEFTGWYDEMGYEWDFENDPVRDGLVLRAGFKSLATEVSDEVYFNDANFTPVLRFMVESDVHISGAVDRRDSYLTESIETAYAYAEKSVYKNLDAALFVGDVSDSGETGVLQRFASTAKAALDLTETKFIVSMGNHDFRTGTVDEAVSNFASIMGTAVDQHLVINGYHFISISPDMNQGINFSESKVTWLEEQLAAALADDPTQSKPIFVMQHEHVSGTVYGSQSWGVSDLKAVLCKYPQVVDFSGHSHYPLSDPRSIWQGTFTALGTGTLNFYQCGINGYKDAAIFPLDKTGGWKGNYSAGAHAAEYLIVEVDASNAIRVIAYDLVSDTEITRYYIRNVADEIKTKYSHIERAKSSVAPAFETSAELALTTDQNTITVEFDQAKAGTGCIVESYRIEVYEKSTGKLAKTQYALSDYFFNPTPAKISVKIESLKSVTEYDVKIFAVNEWNDVCTTPLTGTIVTGQAEAEVLETPDYINILDIQYPGNTGILANIGSENSQYKYNGKSKTFSSVITYYLIVGEITNTDEIRVNVGNSWIMHNVIWYQKTNYSNMYFNFYYSSAPAISTKFELKNNSIYKIEYGLIFAEKGEHKNQWYTYLKIDDKTYIEYYCNAEEQPQTDYVVTMHLTQAFRIADVNLARTVEYYVEGVKKQSDFNINGLYLKEPTAPTKEGYFFVGWYDQEEGGNRVDFREPLNSSESVVKYYARFTDKTHQAKFYNYDGSLIVNQTVGDDCKVVTIDNPVKTHEKWTYSFVKWVIKGTNQEFDFETRLHDDIELEAVFEEYRYKIVYRVDGLEYVTKYYRQSNPKQVIGGEPAVPEIEGANGYWDYSVETRTKGDIYAIARYNCIQTTAQNDIKLNAFSGSTVDIMDDMTRFYMNFADTDKQADWIKSYPVEGGHERQDITFSWNDDAKNKVYYVYFADNADFQNAYIIKADTRSVDYVGIFTPGKTYYWKVYGINTSTWSSVDTFKVLNSGVRWISADTVFNMRDMGGWTTTDGKVINYGLVYRGGQLSLDNAGEKSYMSDYSHKVFDYLGIKTEIELRGDYPHDYNQFNDLEKVIWVNGTGYTDFMGVQEAKHKVYYRQAFTALADASNYPFYYHCSWGADRTGGLGFLIGGVLGVPYEQLVEDYELTSFSYSGSRVREANGFDAMVKAFMDNYSKGGTLQEAVYNYLVDCIGVKPEEIAAMKAIMLSQASEPLSTYTVTYKIDGEVYQTSNVFAGSTISAAAPVYFEKFLDYWTLENGEVYDSSLPVTSDLVLNAHFQNAEFEDYDTITVRDLGVGEQLVPSAISYTYEGTSTTHSRLFVFDYTISASDGKFSDGVHIEFGDSTWLWRAHVWFQSDEKIYVFTDGADATGNSNPTGTYNYSLSLGNTYHITCGVIMPTNGQYAGKKMLFVKVNDDIIAYIPTTADIASSYTVCFAGTEGVLKSVANLMTVRFIGADGTVLETSEVQRGKKISAIEAPEAPENKVFLGWFDQFGNAWDFETQKVLNSADIFAKYGDKTINSVVVDENGMEIQYGYKVKLGIQVSEIETPIVSDENLEFDGWFNGKTRLNPTDVITEDMTLICKFKTKAADPVDPVKPSFGCKSAIASTFGIFAMLALAGAITIKKRRNED